MTHKEWMARLLPRKGWLLVRASHRMWGWRHREAFDVYWVTAPFTHPSGVWREDFERATVEYTEMLA